MLVISPCSLPMRRCPLRSLRSTGCSESTVSGTTTSEASDSFQDTANMIAIVDTTCAVLQIERVTSSVTTAFAFVVSVSMREST